MSSVFVQPIAGVSANRESEIEAVYPAIAGGVLGQIIGLIMGGISTAFPSKRGVLGVPLVVLRLVLFLTVGSVLAPFALLAYAITKLFGHYYVVTNRSVQRRAMIGGAMSQQITLAEISDIEIATSPAYEFHRVGDLNLLNAQGGLLMTISAIPYPQRLKQILIDAREARLLSDASLAKIEARK